MRGRRTWKPGRPLVWLALLAMLFSAVYSVCALEALPAEPVAGELTGSIARVEGNRLFLTDVTLRAAGDASRPGNVLMEAVPCGHVLEAGMTVRAHVTLQPLRPAVNPHGWDERRWFLSDGVRYRCAGTLDAHGETAPFSPRTELRSAVRAHIAALWPEQSGLAAGLLLGAKEEMTDEAQQAFRRSGAAHLLAVSGLHVGFVAALAALLLGWMRRNSAPQVALTLALVGGYALAAESAFSVFRALVMLGMGLAARKLGRRPDGPTALAVAILAALALRPTEVLRAGFLMSVGAVTGILLLCGRVDGALKRLRLPAFLRGSIAVSLSAQLGVLPVQLYVFHTVSLLSVPVSLVAVPMAAGIVMLGLPAVLLHMAWPPLAAAPGFAVRLLLRLLTLLCETVSAVPCAQTDAASPPVFVLLCFVGLLFLCSTHFMEFARRRRIALAAGILCASALSLGLWLPGALDKRRTPTAVFFSVGTADCALLRCGESSLLVDTGWTGGQAVSYLQGEGLKVDAVVLTHRDADHAGGLGRVLDAVPVGAVMAPRGMSWEGQEVALETARELGIPVTELTAGDRFAVGAFTVTVLSPVRVREGRDNADSLVLRVDGAGRTLLLTGDISARTEEALAMSACDVIKVPHHGSATGTSEALLTGTTPAIAVLSVGTPNRYGFPRPEVLERLDAAGAQVWRTDQCGAVTVRFSPQGCSAQGYAPPSLLQMLFLGGA